MKATVCQLSHIGLEVRDPAAWTGFSQEVLGLTADGGGERLRMDENHHRITLEEGPGDDLSYAGWQAEDGASLRGIAQRLEAMGLDVRWASAGEADRRRVEAFFSVSDPNGVRNEVCFGPAKDETPFSSPRGIRGFEAGDLGLGHIVLCVDDIDASLRFYRDGLGLFTSDYIDVDMGPTGLASVAFLHAGPRHHSLALVPATAPKRLHHFMLEVQDLDDVGTTYDLCRDRGVPIAMTLGRHTNDQMVSFYMESPSGFQVEYGHGGLLIDDSTWEVKRYDAPSVWGHQRVV